MSQAHLSFARDQHHDFSQTLRKRVNDYFQNTGKSKFGNGSMIFKSAFMFTLYLSPYFVLIFAPITSPWIVLGLYALMGLGVAGIGLNIMHDANHGVYSRNRLINSIFSYSMNLIGSSASMWRIQHNVLHHTFTNIEGFDEDIENFPFLLRFSPHQKIRWIHRYQHYYAWFFYAQMTLVRVLFSDLAKVFEYRKKGHIRTQKEFIRELIGLILWKVFYFLYALVLPAMILNLPLWSFILGFVLMHQIAGFILAVIFQTAHIMPDVQFPKPDSSGKINDSWLVHELKTTTNFGTGSKILTWITGGLNFQVEHHLFSNVCHVHYAGLSKIVKETTKEFGLPYNSERTFFSAIVKHSQMLKKLGRI